MKTRSFFSAVAFAAMAFTFFACSSDDSGGGSSSSSGTVDLSNLPPSAVSFEGEEISGEINLFMIFENEDGSYDNIPAGKIKNGQLSLDLPAEKSIGKYLENKINGVYFVRKSSITAVVPDESNCRLRPYLIKSGKEISAQFYYFQKSGSFTGTDDGITFDLDFSQGWNLVFYGDKDGNRYLSTDPSKVGGGELEWQFGECEAPPPSSSSWAILSSSSMEVCSYAIDGIWTKDGSFILEVENGSFYLDFDDDSDWWYIEGEIDYCGSFIPYEAMVWDDDDGELKDIPIGNFNYTLGGNTLTISGLSVDFAAANGQWIKY